MSVADLPSHARNEYSQNGEDGILDKIFDVIRVGRGYFVEFGAWDGIHLSNTYALYQMGWDGCYIEGDPTRFRDLQRNVTADGVSKINAFVAPEGENSLDNILKRVNAPLNFDLLSIDIDSDDLAIWRSVSTYVPKVVIIEYNPTIPFDTLFVNVPGKNWGNSALSLVKLGEEKGYNLVCATNTNLIFLREEVNREAGLPIFSLNGNFRGTRYFWGYDGSFFRSDGTTSRCDEILGSVFNRFRSFFAFTPTKTHRSRLFD